MDSHIFQVLSHLCLSTSLEVMRSSAPVWSWGHWQALRERDSFRMEKRWETGGESWPRSVNSELKTQPAREMCEGLCGAIEWGLELRGWWMSGQNPEGYEHGCQVIWFTLYLKFIDKKSEVKKLRREKLELKSIDTKQYQMLCWNG